MFRKTLALFANKLYYDKQDRSSIMVSEANIINLTFIFSKLQNDFFSRPLALEEEFVFGEH